MRRRVSAYRRKKQWAGPQQRVLPNNSRLRTLTATALLGTEQTVLQGQGKQSSGRVELPSVTCVCVEVLLREPAADILQHSRVVERVQ